MRNYKVVVLLTVLALWSCQRAEVSGSVSPVPISGKLFIEVPSGAEMSVVDSTDVSADGSFCFRFDVKKGRPEFVYLYDGQRRLASLVLKQGDKVRLKCGGANLWEVEGSEDCSLLLSREEEFVKAYKGDTVSMRDYVAFYRNSLHFVMSNSHSIVVVPVLLQKMGDTPVFAQLTDGLIFASIADSLSTVYPESGYVAALRAEASVRTQKLKLQSMISSAGEVPYPDLVFPDVEGKDRTLSENVGKCTMLVFWDPSDPVCNRFNVDVLKPLYARYGARGMNVYQVCIGYDKRSWALAVKEQELPWINVCDTRGLSIARYGVNEVPAVFLVSDNAMESVTPTDVESQINNFLE